MNRRLHRSRGGRYPISGLENVEGRLRNLRQLAQGERHEQARGRMREMVLALVARAQEPQVLLRPADVIFGRSPNPVIVGMALGAVAHHAGDGLKGFCEWFHGFISLWQPQPAPCSAGKV